MSDTETETKYSKGVKLNNGNYAKWVIQTRGKLMTAGVWRIVDEKVKKTSTNADKWDEGAEKAAGIILSSLDDSQYIHAEGYEDDPIKLWAAFKAAHQSQVATNRFHVLQKLLSIRNIDGESLTDFMTRINGVVNELTALAPTALTAKDIISEIGIHVAIAGLDNTKYQEFASSVLLLTNLDRTKVVDAFRNEDLKREAAASAETTAALVASRIRTTRSAPSTPGEVVVGRNGLGCTHCKKPGHTADNCWELHPEKRRPRGARAGGGKAKDANTAKEETPVVHEFGGSTQGPLRI